MRVPQDIANLLALAIRDVIWFKRNVIGLLNECQVPATIMLEVNRLIREGTPTIRIIHHVLDRLGNQGHEGFLVARRLLTRMYYWNDLHSVSSDRKDQAVASLRAFRQGFDRFRAQQEYIQAQQAQERQMQAEREQRGQLSNLDHEKLRSFRDEFDQIHSIADRQVRGRRFEALMRKIFDYYCEDSRGAIRRTGEQIDGLFKFDNHWHYVEVRWTEEKATAADVSVLRDRARNAYGGDTKALFISFNGFTQECLDSLAQQSDERVILMDGYDLRCVLNCDIAFDVLLAEKQVELVSNKLAFVSAAEIIQRRQATK